MTNEQYYWFVRRPQILKAYAMANNLHQVQGAGSDDNSIEVKTETELRDAIENAKDGQPVKLTASMTLATSSSPIIIETGKNTIIDLNGQTITATQLTGDTKDTIFGVKRGATLTLNGNGTVDGTDAAGKIYCALKPTIKGESTEGEVAKIIVNGGTYKATYYGLTGNGSRQNTDVTINNGTFEGVATDSLAIYHPENGKLVINNGTFKGADGISVKSGQVTINGGEFKAIGPKGSYSHNAGGWNNTGDCIAVEACDYPGQLPTIEITGGTFYSENGKPVASYAQPGYEAQRLTKFVKGGKFNKELDVDLIADGYEQELVDGWYVVTAK